MKCSFMRKMNILLAEDDADDKFFFVYFLKDRQDIRVLDCAENGLDVFKYLEDPGKEKGLPDIILLDQNMPKMNGLDTLKRLKADPEYAHIPVFVYSTYADQNLTDNCMACGAVSVAQKPTNKDGYNQMIDEFIERIASKVGR